MVRVLSPKEVLAKNNPFDEFIKKSDRWLDAPKDLKEIKKRLEIIKGLIYQHSFPLDVSDLDQKALFKIYRKMWSTLCILKDFLRCDISHRLNWNTIEFLSKEEQDANYIKDYQKYINPNHCKSNIDIKI